MTRAEALEILGLDSNASLDDARKAYRTLAKIYHPDKSSSPNATAMFRIVFEAWEVIQNTADEQYAETEVGQKQTSEESAHKRDEEEQRRQNKEAQQQAERKATQAEDLKDRDRIFEWFVEEKIRSRSWLTWFIISLFPCLIIMIGSWLGVSGFSGSIEDFSTNKNFIKFLLGRKLFTDSEPIDWIYFGGGSLLISFFVAAILGPITGSVIIKIRRWFK
ncbi:hypothetical protein C6501_01110 [Candidatus Poribacteria bacterium]|nr:MAG: hypothetical protein C6501_01110 [Candidatus Poribacteria bacterium]